jgi:hypothetical protein
VNYFTLRSTVTGTQTRRVRKSGELDARDDLAALIAVLLAVKREAEEEWGEERWR